MKKYLKIDFYRIRHNPGVAVVLILGIVIGCLQFYFWANGNGLVLSGRLRAWNPFYTGLQEDWGQLDSTISSLYVNTWQEEWMGGEWGSVYSYLYFLLIPIFISVVYGDSITFDKTSGYYKNIVIRGSRKKYYQSKLLSSFVSGGTVVLIPLIVNMLMCMSVLPHVVSDPAAGASVITRQAFMVLLYFSHPLIYTFVYMLIIFVFCGLMSSLTVMIGSITDNRFLPLILPEIVYMFANLLCQSTMNQKWSPFCFLSPSQRAIANPWIILFEMLLMIVLIVILYLFNVKREEIV